MPALLEEYNDLIRGLDIVGNGDQHVFELNDLYDIYKRESSELLLLMFGDDGSLVATAQATYSAAGPKVYVERVVVARSQRGQGLGEALMTELHDRIRIRWPRARSVMLTSHPKRRTQGFYERCGYTSRIGENATTVFNMEL